MMVDLTYVVDSDVFITTGRAESSASTGYAANYSRVPARRISSGG